MTDFVIKRGDLEPPLVIDVSGSAGDLTGVSSWKVIGRQDGATLFTDTGPGIAVGSPNTTAAITHAWTGTETATVGDVDVEVEATWPGGRKQTFPPGRYLRVRIVADLA